MAEAVRFSQRDTEPLRCRRAAPFLLPLTVALVCGCGWGPGVREIDDVSWFERENRSALDSASPSERTGQFLRREGLAEPYEIDPLTLMQQLDARLLERRERVVAFHLAELAYLEAGRADELDQTVKLYLSSVEYAYAYLFDRELTPPANSFDPIFRWTCDLYNRSLANVVIYIAERMLLRTDDPRLPLIAGELRLLPGPLELRWDRDAFEAFLVSYNYEVVGLRGLSRTYGLGVPSIAVRSPVDEPSAKEDLYLPKVKQAYATTAVFRFQGSIIDRAASAGTRSASVEIYDPIRTTAIQIGDRSVPLEVDLTTPLAYGLEITPQASGLQGMLDPGAKTVADGFFMLQPYQSDKIPVVFVHGLMSSPVTWVQLLNDVLDDPVLRERYQFWYFGYPTGNPILYSASNLRVSLSKIQQTYDPDGTNPAFQNTLICGHSMGGLVSKLMVLSSGDRLWDIVFDTTLEETELSAEERALLTRTLFFETLPFIKRMVLMATPHRGSDMATGFVGRLGAKLTTLPTTVRTTLSSLRVRLSRRSDELAEAFADENSATGIGNLAPGHAGQAEIVTWSFPEYLQVHSIIGNLEAADTPGGSDGIVPYESSHLDCAVSEKIVKSDHSVHERPLAILELRRILHLHLESLESPAKVGRR